MPDDEVALGRILDRICEATLTAPDEETLAEATPEELAEARESARYWRGVVRQRRRARGCQETGGGP